MNFSDVWDDNLTDAFDDITFGTSHLAYNKVWEEVHDEIPRMNINLDFAWRIHPDDV